MLKMPELISWIIKNRRGNAFKDYLATDIMAEIICAYKYGTGLIVTNQKGKPTGICLGELRDNGTTIYIKHFLITDRNLSIKYFSEYAKAHFPTVTKFAGLRHGQLQYYPVNKI